MTPSAFEFKADVMNQVEPMMKCYCVNGKYKIRFAQECAQLALEGALRSGFLVLNGETEDGEEEPNRNINVLVQNIERNVCGKFKDMVADPDDSLESVEVVYRRKGAFRWISAKDMADQHIILSSLTEDSYGFVSEV